MDSSSPYANVPQTARWRDAVAKVPSTAVDPHTGFAISISPSTRIASAGSCFAMRIAEILRESGYGYMVVEPGLPFATDEDNRAAGYGLASARYGNIYTARQLVQLFDRAFGRFDPAEPLWRSPEGAVVDPFRPRAQPGGFGSAEECLADRRLHLEAVRRLFTEVEIFVFTLGLTEAWECVADGAVLPVCPSSGAGGEFDPQRYRFHNFTLAEVSADLEGFFARLAEVNPAAKVILTVSPVPLAATCEPRHVLQSTVYSKSVLRVAAEEAVRAHPDGVYYFASYEIVGCTANGDYLGDDRRTPSPEAVAHVMRSFFRQFCGLDAPPERTAGDAKPAELPSSLPPCDEDEMVAAMAAQAQGAAVQP